jgi:KDO2-lipid IV(A) lauroyltransferase
MDQKQKKQQATPSDYFVYAGYRTFEFLLKLIPVSWVCRFGTFMGTLSYHLLKNRRKTVTQNLRIAFGSEMSHEEIHQLTRETFRNTGSNLIASFRSALFSEAEIRKRVEISGAENLDIARQNGTGIIALIGHMGNWELMAQIHLVLPALNPTATLYRPIDNPLIDALIKRRRGSEGTALFSRRDGFFKPISHIKSGGSLGILADQHAGKHGVAIPFFGKLTSMTNLPAIMHRRTGASIVPLSMAATRPGYWKVTVHPPIEIPAEQKTNTTYITGLCAKAYECSMRDSPANVFWMHGYWKTGRHRCLKIDGLQKKRTGLQRSLATNPFRVIVYTGDASSENQEIYEQLKRLKNYRPDIHLTTVGSHQILKEADHHITIDGEDLPEKLRQYDLSQPAPIDCALDFTRDAQGAPAFKQAEFRLIFTMFGEHQGRVTRSFFAKTPNPTLHDFLNSLGIDQ